MAEKIVGILGGMGPDATVDLFQKILRATPATRDQEHLRIIVDCNSKIPDRTAHIISGAEDPWPYLHESAQLLERAGVNLIVIPCNAAHNWHDRIQASVKVPVLHIMQATADHVQANYPSVTKVGLLAVPATVKVGLYHRAFANHGIEVIAPDKEHQELTTKAIFAVKAGDSGPEVTALLIKAGEHLIVQGAQAVVAGCTEIPLVLKDGDLSVPVIDATRALATAAVKMARGED
ncbi:MAG: aspartate/glutamate racemase family protein [bacterium]|jgi:aspartate racemase